MFTSKVSGARVRGSLARFAGAALLGTLAATACSSDDNTTTTTTATSLAIVSGSGQSATVGVAATSPIVVQVNDQNGNPKSGVMVTFTTSGGATVNSTTATTDANGRASANVTLGTTAGMDTVTVTAAGISTNAIFAFTANAGAATSLAIVSGNNQSATHGTALTNPLVVQAKDQYGNFVNGATIDWTTTAGVFAGTTQSTTDATGDAQAALQLPAVAGTVTATATLHGTNSTAVFTETAM